MHTSIAVVGALALCTFTTATHLTSDRLSKVKNVMLATSTASWENGTVAQALLEDDYPTLSVFSPLAVFPIPSPLTTDQFSEVFNYAQVTLQNRGTNNLSLHGGQSLLVDGAAGDPASLGIAVLLANASTNNAQVNGVGYGDAARAELNYLLYNVPRTPSGAISHRASQAQLWADSVYMVPPFLAYYGALHSNKTLLEEAYTQCKLYRATLRQSSGLWAHIALGNSTSDPSLWATGNAWAAAGMLRVHATIFRSEFASSMGTELSDLQSWITEILSAAGQHITGDNLLHNHIDDTSTFEDASGAALIAATSLRLSTQNLTNDYVTLGVNLLAGVSAKVNSTGYISPVVNPWNFAEQGTVSPEAQAFVVMAYAAYDQWVAQGKSGNPNGSSDPLGKSSSAAPGVRLPSLPSVTPSFASLVIGIVGLLGWSIL